MLFGSGADDASRAALQQANLDYNAALKASCEAYSNCTYTNSTYSNVQFQLDDLSTVDRFHPSASGQAKLAAAMWNDGFLAATGLGSSGWRWRWRAVAARAAAAPVEVRAAAAVSGGSGGGGGGSSSGSSTPTPAPAPVPAPPPPPAPPVITLGSGGFTPPLGLTARPLTLNLGTNVNLDSPAWLQVGVRTTVGHRMITIVQGSKIGGVRSGKRHQWMYFHGQGAIALDTAAPAQGDARQSAARAARHGRQRDDVEPRRAAPLRGSVHGERLARQQQTPLGLGVHPRTLVLATSVGLDGSARLRVGVRTAVGHRMITIVRGSTIGGAKSGKRHQWLSHQGQGTIALNLRLLRKATPGKLQLVLLAKGANGKTTTLVVPVRYSAP